MTSLPTTLVVLDPTSEDGEAALSMLTTADDHVALLAVVHGPTGAALREYAVAEHIDLVTAGWTYLDQAAERAAAPGRLVMQVLTDGPSVSDEVLDFTRSNVTRRVLLPASLERVDPAGLLSLRQTVAAPLAVVAVAELHR